jgi:hypothetical protein
MGKSPRKAPKNDRQEKDDNNDNDSHKPHGTEQSKTTEEDKNPQRNILEPRFELFLENIFDEIDLEDQRPLLSY